MQENPYTMSKSAGERPENKKKNRYKNILPCEQITLDFLCYYILYAVFLL